MDHVITMEGKEMRRKVFNVLIGLFVAVVFGMAGCGGGGGAGTNGTVPALVADSTEVWSGVANSGQGSSSTTLKKYANGSISATGQWVFNFQGATVTCPFTAGSVTISGNSVSYTGNGTATNPSAPAGYQTSPFTLTVNGTQNDGQGSGSFTITCTTYGWPGSTPAYPVISGNWTAQKQSGSGVTAGTQNTGNTGNTNDGGATPKSWNKVGTEQMDGAENVVIKVDETNKPYVAYRDLTHSNGLTVKKYNGVNWDSIMPAGTGGSFSLGLDLVTGEAAQYSAYHQDHPKNDSANPITVLSRIGQTWQVISNSNNFRGGPSFIGNDGYWVFYKGSSMFDLETYNGIPYVALDTYKSNYPAYVYLQKYEGGSWVDLGNELGIASFGTSMHLEFMQGKPVVAFTIDNWHGDMKATVKRFDGAAWSSIGPDEFPIQNGQAASVSALAIDGVVPYVALAVDSTQLIVNKYENGSWAQVGDAIPVNFYRWLSAELLVRDGTPYLFYVDPTTKKPVAKKVVAGKWVNVGQAISLEVNACTSVSAAMAGDGTIYISFTDDSAHYNKLTVMSLKE